MGVRGEVFSTKVALQNRTYFFNVKENRLGDLYLNIVESKNRDEGGFDRQSVILFAEDLQEFLRGFDESLRVLEKSVREKRRGTAERKERPFDREKRQDRDDGENDMPRRGFRSKRDNEDFRDRPPRRPRSDDRPRRENDDSSGGDFSRGEPRIMFRGERRPRGPRPFGRDRKDSGHGRDRGEPHGPKSGFSSRKDTWDKERPAGPGRKKVIVRKK